jgi:hypothetical protein
MEPLLKKTQSSHVVLGIIFIIYLIMGYPIPETLADMIDTIYGKIIVYVIALTLLVSVNPVLGVLGLFVAFDLIRRSEIATGRTALLKFGSSEKQKMGDLTAFNQFPYTLEQEMVKLRTINKDPPIESPPSYKPFLLATSDASPVSA